MYSQKKKDEIFQKEPAKGLAKLKVVIITQTIQIGTLKLSTSNNNSRITYSTEYLILGSI